MPASDSETTLPIHDELADLSVADYLAMLWPDRSRRVISALFARAAVRSGGRPVAKDRELRSLADLTLVGDVDAIEKIPCPPASLIASLPILHEDARLVVLDKPSGLPVVPDRGRSEASCLGVLIRRELEERASKPPSRYCRYRIVHRLDRLTSGVLLVARTPESERQLHAYFERHRIRKTYLALIDGCPEAARVTVRCPIVPGRKGKMRALGVADAAMAETTFEVLERFPDCSLVRAMPRTGRTHQIRVHAWAWGHPLYIDPLYGKKPQRSENRLKSIDRLTLHAVRYTLPETWGEPRSFEGPLASDFAAALAELRGDSETETDI